MDTDQWRIYAVEGAEQLAKLAGWEVELEAKRAAGRDWLKAHGGTDFMETNIVYAMLIDVTKPLPAGWYKPKDQRGTPAGSVAIWPLTKTKAGKALVAEMRALTLPRPPDAARAIGVVQVGMKVSGMGMMLLKSQCIKIGCRWFLLYPECEGAPELPGCRLLKLSEFYAMKEAAEATEPATA